MLWDVSWDQVNVIYGKRYSEYAYATLHGGTCVPPLYTPLQPPFAGVPSPWRSEISQLVPSLEGEGIKPDTDTDSSRYSASVPMNKVK